MKLQSMRRPHAGPSSIKNGMLALATSALLALTACGGGSSGDETGTEGSLNLPATVLKNPGKGSAKLGTLKDATVEVFDTHSDEPIYTTTTDASGQYKIDLGGRPMDEIYRVQISGGVDVDFNDTGAAGQTPVPNNSTLSALATGKQIVESGVSVTILTDILAKRVGDNVAWNAPALIMRELDGAAQSLIDEDINGDGNVDYLDILAFDPQVAEHKNKLAIEYADFFLKNDLGHSIMDLYHSNDPDLSEELNAMLSDAINIKLLDADASPLAAVSFGVQGHGTLTTAGVPNPLDHESGRYQVTVNKSSTQRIEVRATPAEGSSLIGWEGCDQDQGDPLLCLATPDGSKSVLAIFKDKETPAQDTTLLRISAVNGTAGFVLNKDKAIVTVPSTDPLVAKLDAALSELASNQAHKLFVGADTAKLSTVRVTAQVSRTVLQGVVRYELQYEAAVVTDALANGSVYAPMQSITVDRIAALQYALDGSTPTKIVPKTLANSDAVQGPNPVDSSIDQQLCGSTKTQNILVDDSVACIDKSEQPIQSAEGDTEVCAAPDVEVETLDGEDYCINPNDIHTRSQVTATSARLRSSGLALSKPMAANLALQALQQPVQLTTMATPSFKKGQVVWLVGYGKAIYLAHNVFMIDKADGSGISMVTAEGPIEMVDNSNKSAMAYQLCSKNINAPECRFFGQTQAAAINKPANGKPSQFELFPVPILWEFSPDGHAWIKFKFKANVDLTGQSSANFDWGTLWYAFGSRGRIEVTPYLNTTIAADGLSIYQKPSFDSPPTERAEVSKPAMLKSGEPVFEKDLISIDFLSSIPGVNTVSPVLESKLKLSIGVDAAGNAKIEIVTDYKQVVAWDVRSEFTYYVYKDNHKLNSFKIGAKGFPGATIKGDLNASVGLFAKAAITMGPRAILPELASVEAKYYLMKVEALGKAMLSYQTDPVKVAAQSGQNFCWAGAVSLTLKDGVDIRAKIDFAPKDKTLKEAVKYIDVPKWEWPIYSFDRIRFTIGTKQGVFVKKALLGAEVDATGTGYNSNDVLAADTKLQCASPSPDVMPTERVYDVGNLQIDGGISIYTKTHELTLQPDGNLVIYAWNGKRGKPVWATGTNGKGVYNQAKLQEDGNLVIYDMLGQSIWSSSTFGVGVKKLKLTVSGTLELQAFDGTVLWSSNAGINTLPSRRDFTAGGLTLGHGDAILTSNRSLVMQPDGNLVLYRVSEGRRDGATWSSGTRDGERAVFQPDGNLVVYRADGSAAWSSNTYGRGATTLSLQPDGNLVIYANESALWARGL